MTQPQCNYRTSAKALILDDQKRFLLSLEHVGKWELPGGGFDHGETHEECIRREIAEEMGLEVTSVAAQPCYFTTAQREQCGTWKANVFFETTLKNMEFTPSDECVELRFCSVEEARALPCFDSVHAFLDQYDPSNHG